MGGALEGLRVLDLSNGMAGALMGMMLADNGAEVIKIDPPGGPSHRYLPGDLVWRRGKKSVALDVKSPLGAAALLRLADTADVLVESFRPGVTARQGIDYETAIARNPRLVYTTITGYGSTGPLADRPGYDALVQARIGLQAEQPLHSARPAIDRDGPIMIGIPLPSIGAFFMALYATMAALIARETTGEGQHVETSLFQGVLANMTMKWWRTEQGGPAGPGSMVDGKMIPWLPTIFESKDGVWFFTMGTRRFQKEYAEFLGLPAGYQAIPVDVSHDDQHRLYHHMQERFRQHPWRELEAIFERLDCIVLPVQPASAAFDDPQIQHNGYIVEVDDPVYGRLRQVGVPYSMAETPPAVQGPAPVLGRDTETVLLSAGLSRDEVRALREAQAI